MNKDELFLKILSDIHCEVYIDDEFRLVAKKNTLTKVSLCRGEYFIRLVSTVNPSYSIDQIITLEYDKVLKVDFVRLVKSNPEFLRDTDIPRLTERSFKNLLTGEVISVSYDSCKEFYRGRAIVAKNKKFGLISMSGEEIIPCIYDEIDYFFPKCVLRVKINDKYRLINLHTGKEYNSHEYDMIKWNFGSSMVGYRDGKCILFDDQGSEILQCSYDEIYFARNGYEVCRSGMYGLIDKNGNTIVPCIYDKIDDPYDGLIKVNRHGKYGFVNMNGDEVIPCIYDWAHSFKNGFAFVSRNGHSGYIDKHGRIIVPLIYDHNHNISFTDIGFDKYGIAIVSHNKKFGCVNREGKEIFPCTLDWVHTFNKDKKACCRNKECMIIDSRGKIEKLKYEYISTLTNGLALVQYKGLYGYIDENYNEIVPCIYNNAHEFVDGIAIVRKNKYWGCIDRMGNSIVPAIYYRLESPIQGLIIALTPQLKSGIVRKDGVELVPCKYDSFRGPYDEVDTYRENEYLIKDKLLGEGCVCVKYSGKFGFINSKGQEIIPCTYEYAHDFKNGSAFVILNGNRMFIDKHGNVL